MSTRALGAHAATRQPVHVCQVLLVCSLILLSLTVRSEGVDASLEGDHEPMTLQGGDEPAVPAEEFCTAHGSLEPQCDSPSFTAEDHMHTRGPPGEAAALEEVSQREEDVEPYSGTDPLHDPASEDGSASETVASDGEDTGGDDNDHHHTYADEGVQREEDAAALRQEQVREQEEEAAKQALVRVLSGPSSSSPSAAAAALFRAPRLTRDQLAHTYYYAVLPLLVSGNTTKMVERVQESVAAGHGRLHWLLGVLYANGIGVPQSEARAILHYSFAALDGVAEAHLALGYRYFIGYGVCESCPLAAAHYREAADAVALTVSGAHHPGHADLGDFYLKSGIRDGKAKPDRDDLNTLMYLVDDGNLAAMVMLGMYYLSGSHGVPKNSRKGLELLNRAAQGRDASAHGVLGQLYVMGDATADPPIQRDIQKAIAHLRSGAEMRDGLSLNGLGYLHALGYMNNKAEVLLEEMEGDQVVTRTSRTEPDFETAADYFRQGIQHQVTSALYNYAVLTLHGRGGVPKSEHIALKLFKQAAEAGSVVARWQLGRLLESQQHCAEAVQHYKVVARLGSWSAAHVADAEAILQYGTLMMATARAAAGGETSDSVHAKWPQRHASGRGGDGVHSGHGDVDESGDSAISTPALRDLENRALREYIDEADSILHRGPQERSASVVAAASAKSPVVELIEQLMLAEAGQLQGQRRVLELLSESVMVVGELERDEALVEEGWVDPENYALAVNADAQPSDIARHVDERTIFLDWTMPTLPASPPPRQRRFLSQKEAKAFLRHRILSMCARQHDAFCAEQLGDFYYYSPARLIGADLPLAVHYYERAARRFSSRAMFNLGIMYQFGLGVHGARRSSTTEKALTGPQQLRKALRRIVLNDPKAHRRVDIQRAMHYYQAVRTTDPDASPAVIMALISLNIQWWWLRFSSIPNGLLARPPTPMPFYQPPPSDSRVPGVTPGHDTAPAEEEASPSTTTKPHGGADRKEEATASRLSDEQKHEQQNRQQRQTPRPPEKPSHGRRNSNHNVVKSALSYVTKVLHLVRAAEDVLLVGAVTLLFFGFLLRHHAFM